jgi:hypothetical protein
MRWAISAWDKPEDARALSSSPPVFLCHCNTFMNFSPADPSIAKGKFTIAFNDMIP